MTPRCNLAKRQQELLNEQMATARKSVEWAFGFLEKPNGNPAEPVQVVSPPVPVGTVRPKTRPTGPAPEIPVPVIADRLRHHADRNIAQKVAIVTGAASGIGEAVVRELAYRGAKAVLLVDRSERVYGAGQEDQ